MNLGFSWKKKSLFSLWTGIQRLLCNFLYFWQCWVFVAVRVFLQLWWMGATLQWRCTGFSLWWLLLLQSTSCRSARFSSCGSWVLEHRPDSCTSLAAPQHVGSSQIRDWTSVLHWQVDSLPLSHQGSPWNFLFFVGRVPWRASTITYWADCWVWACKLKAEVEFTFMV